MLNFWVRNIAIGSIIIIIFGIFDYVFKLGIFSFIWSILNQNLVSTTIGTLLGVYIAFRLALNGEKRVKEHSYGVIADQISFEWLANSAYAKEIITSLKSGYATVRRFNVGMAELALGGSYLYEFAPREFINKLRIYKENIIVINRLMDFYFENKNNTQEDINKLKEQINNIIELIDEIGKIPMR